MAVTSETLRQWARGATKDAELEEPEDDTLGEAEEFEEEEEEVPEEGEAEENRLWAEGAEEEEEVEEGEAEEMMDWLEENEPEIHDALVALGDAIASGDEMALDAAKDQLKSATQYLNPEYPELTEGQKEKASEKISEHMQAKGSPEKDSPEWKQAVAIGMAQARKEDNPGEEEEEEPEEIEEVEEVEEVEGV
jgi:hypothetical protein